MSIRKGLHHRSNVETLWSFLLFGPYLEIGALALASFLGVFYTFRLHTRLLWIIASPMFIAVLPVFGNDIYMRLTRPAGHEEVVMIEDPVVLLVSYSGFMLCWFLIRLIGWRLTNERNVAIRDQISLQELMAITAIVAVVLFSYRHGLASFGNSQFTELIANGQGAVLMFAYVSSMFGGVILGALSRRRRWIVFWGLLPIFASLLFVISFSMRFKVYHSHLLGLILPLLITVGACLVARQNGYRVTQRSSLVPDAADEMVPVVDQSSTI